jgi:rRNA pseudouridine-1189 N-methylase Emg1 (Nep1/Mra1 family)
MLQALLTILDSPLNKAGKVKVRPSAEETQITAQQLQSNTRVLA